MSHSLTLKGCGQGKKDCNYDLYIHYCSMVQFIYQSNIYDKLQNRSSPQNCRLITSSHDNPKIQLQINGISAHFPVKIQFILLNLYQEVSENLNSMSKSTFGTAISIASSAIGSAMIIFPLNYVKYGIIQNLICLAITATCLSLTCSIYGMHLLPSQNQITQTIKRLLGQSFFKALTLVSGIQLTIVSCVFFLLAGDILFDVFYNIDEQLFPDQKLFKYVLLLLLAVLTVPKHLGIVFALSPYAVGALMISTLILIFSFPLNIQNLDSGIIELKPFSFKNLLLILSINSFGFTCHASISPILKQNQNPGNNKKSIFLGFLIMAILYMMVGVGGALAIYGKNPQKSQTVLDYFQGEWQSIVIGLLNSFYVICVLPIFPFVSKTQLIGLLSEEKQKDPKTFTTASIIFVVVWLLFNFLFITFEVDASVVIGFIGSVLAIFFTYYIPTRIIYIAGKTVYIGKIGVNGQNVIQTPRQDSGIYAKQQKLSQTQGIQVSLLSQQNEPSQNSIPYSFQISNSIQNERSTKSTQKDDTISSTQKDKSTIVIDEGYIIKHIPIDLKEKILYGVVLVYGICLFIFQIGSIIKGFFD